MRSPDQLCVACGARRDEHEAEDGSCARTKCKGFSDSYYAFNEGGYGPTDLPKPADRPIQPSYQTKAEWSVAGIVIWTAIVLALAMVLLYLVAAVFKFFAR